MAKTRSKKWGGAVGSWSDGKIKSYATIRGAEFPVREGQSLEEWVGTVFDDRKMLCAGLLAAQRGDRCQEAFGLALEHVFVIKGGDLSLSTPVEPPSEPAVTPAEAPQGGDRQD